MKYSSASGDRHGLICARCTIKDGRANYFHSHSGPIFKIPTVVLERGHYHMSDTPLAWLAMTKDLVCLEEPSYEIITHFLEETSQVLKLLLSSLTHNPCY
jgi:hypothetical protein